jgi:hypothetical protein
VLYSTTTNRQFLSVHQYFYLHLLHFEFSRLPMIFRCFQLSNKNCRMQKRISKSGKNWGLWAKLRKHRFSTPFWILRQFCRTSKSLVVFLGATLDYQQIRVKKLFLKSPLGDVSAEILQDFFFQMPPSWFLATILVLFLGWLFLTISIKYEYFITQNSLQNGKMFTRWF